MPKSRTSSRRKTPKKTSLYLSIKLPPKNVREKFLIIYELEGCQKAVNYLTKYYRVRRMTILLNGKRVRKGWVAWYLENQACFKKNGLVKRIVLHELYHHLVEVKNLEMSLKTEEKEANYYARYFLRNQKTVKSI
jgi:hypothetical protein